MSTMTKEAEAVTEYIGSFIVRFKDKVTIPRDDNGFDIEDGVAHISQGKFETIPGFYRFTVDGVESEIDADEIDHITLVG